MPFFLFDRGFRRVSFLDMLVSHGVDFVVRIKTDVHVQIAGWDRTIALGNVPIKPGRMLDLGVVALRKTMPIGVGIVGVWDRRAKLPWWLATSLDTAPKDIVQAYYKRMAVEEQFRDIKGHRFGLALNLSCGCPDDCTNPDRDPPPPPPVSNPPIDARDTPSPRSDPSIFPQSSQRRLQCPRAPNPNSKQQTHKNQK